MFTIDDLLEELNAESDGTVNEVFSHRDKPQAVSPAEIKALFPNIKFSDSDTVAYIPVKMCHSLPTVNARGRCFTASTIARSYKTAEDQLVNLDHNLKNNRIGDGDRIIGHIKATAIPLAMESASEIANVPTEPMPLYALTCLFLRGEGVGDMITKHLSGKETWLTSMECGHDFRQAELYYNNEFIPITDAESGMLRCIKQGSVDTFKGNKLSLCLGGREGTVKFWGLGMTKIPADNDAGILGIYAGRSLDVASKNIFYMPCVRGEVAHADNEDQLVENIEKEAERIFKELANIEIIGSTQPSSLDGHTHYLLSDLTILPSNGHDHYLQNKILSRGSQPRLTGLTGTHVEYIRTGEYPDDPATKSVEHAHLIDIPLRGKFQEEEPEMADDKRPDNVLDIELSNLFINGESKVTLKELLAKLDALANKPEQDGLKSEIAAIRQEIVSMNSEQELAKKIEEEIASRIESGSLLTKEVAEKNVEDAVSEKEKEFEAQQKQDAMKAARLELIGERKINLDTIFDEEIKNEDGKPMTIRDRLESIPLTDEGEREFKTNVAMWGRFAVEEEEEEEGEETAVETASKPTPIVGSPAGKNGRKKSAKITEKAAKGRSRFSRFQS